MTGSEKHGRRAGHPGPSIPQREAPQNAERGHPGASLTDRATSRQAISLERVVRFLPWLVSLVADGVQSFVLPLEGHRQGPRLVDVLPQRRADPRTSKNVHRITGDKDFFAPSSSHATRSRSARKSQNVETLNWYIDPVEFDEIRHNMEPYKEVDAVSKTGHADATATICG